jgi:hypothetical protein
MYKDWHEKHSDEPSLMHIYHCPNPNCKYALSELQKTVLPYNCLCPKCRQTRVFDFVFKKI